MFIGQFRITAAQRDAENDPESAAALAKYEASADVEDVTRAEQVPGLSSLQLYRASFLPAEHPARAAIAAAVEAGWRWPEPPKAAANSAEY